MNECKRPFEGKGRDDTDGSLDVEAFVKNEITKKYPSHK
jgi:hypothetical protein